MAEDAVSGDIERMTTEEFARLRALFDEAMGLPPGARQPFIDAKTPPGDPLRMELLAMVDAGDDSRFLANAFLSGVPENTPAGGHDLPLQIGNYRILRELGRGGMGVVYLALRNDDVFHKVVALKVIGGLGASEPNFIQRFKQERQILAGLDHPNIARILDGGNTEDGRPFYVMEYIAGSPIDEYCNRVSADVQTRVRMIAEVCDAVEYLHGHAIAHRDIKPNNILVTAEGRVKLVDFGIAKVDTLDGLVASPSSPGEPTMIMTPGYASPEQIAGNPAGKSGDIYSIGVVLYQLLTGRLPYLDSEGRPNLAAQLVGVDPKPPSKELAAGAKPATRNPESRRTSHPDLDRVVLTALQRDPLRRYLTVRILAEDLRRCLDGRPIVARPESSAYRFRKLVSRNRVAALLSAMLVIVACAGAWMVVAGRMERAQLEAKQAEAERLVALLNARVARWLDSQQAVPLAEKIADVQAANQLISSGALRSLSAQASDRERLRRLVAEMRRFLDRADALSQGQTPLRKEIAMVYRQVGDFESTAPKAQNADKAQAAVSYRRAATVAASIRSVEPAWADGQLSELGGRLQELGSSLNVGAAPSSEPSPLPPPPLSSPSEREPVARTAPAAKTAVAQPAPAGAPPAVDRQEQEELVGRLKTTAANAERARRNLEVLRDTLAGQGQAVRTDLLTSMSQVDALIEDARNSLISNDLTSARDELQRAASELRKVFQAVGG
ncbi:MAG: serine/threonine-protein kinase [Acidobacteriota bacterium]